MAVSIKKKQQPLAVVTTETAYKNKVTSSDTKEVAVGPPIDVPEPHATVGFQASRKISDGNYGSFAVGVSLCWPCSPTDAALEETFAKINQWCDDKMQALLTEGQK